MCTERHKTITNVRSWILKPQLPLHAFFFESSCIVCACVGSLRVTQLTFSSLMMYNFTHLHPSAVNHTDYFYDPIYRLQFRCKTWIVRLPLLKKQCALSRRTWLFKENWRWRARFNLYYISNTDMNNQGSEYNLILCTYLLKKKKSTERTRITYLRPRVNHLNRGLVSARCVPVILYAAVINKLSVEPGRFKVLTLPDTAASVQRTCAQILFRSRRAVLRPPACLPGS